MAGIFLSFQKRKIRANRLKKPQKQVVRDAAWSSVFVQLFWSLHRPILNEPKYHPVFAVGIHLLP